MNHLIKLLIALPLFCNRELLATSTNSLKRINPQDLDHKMKIQSFLEWHELIAKKRSIIHERLKKAVLTNLPDSTDHQLTKNELILAWMMIDAADAMKKDDTEAFSLATEQMLVQEKVVLREALIHEKIQKNKK